MLIEDIKKVEPVFTMTSGKMVAILFKRGVTMQDIFAIYYQLEAIADARADEIFGSSEEGHHGAARPRQPLTVADALLAGVVSRDMPNPKPF